VSAERPDVIEWRADFFEQIADTAAVLETAEALRAAVGDAPVILIRRSSREGGEAIALGDEDVVRLYNAVGASGRVDFLDFEMGNDTGHVNYVVETAHRQAARVILSYHNFGYTPGPEFLVQRFLEAELLDASPRSPWCRATGSTC
jgi:3-dehydroquinate dehydratase-1